MKPIKAVPTNIITGALGVGKTTLIKAILAKKPKAERWAVLVNEFGEVGIDGALLANSFANCASNITNIFIREVPGGCMCCTAGLSMQIALNQLLAQSRPHRLLIEPTGLGHPREVLETLSAPHYKSVLDINSTLTLIDPRKLRDERWRNHAIFKEQMQVADCIVATKSDVTDAADKTLLDNYLCSLQLSNVKRVNTQNGEIDWQLLLGPSGFGQNPKSMKNHQTLPHTSMLASPRVSKANSPVKVSNKGQGYYSYGWVMPPDREYAYQRVIEAIDTIDVERLKAILITDAGIHSFNLEGKALTCLTLNYAADSRLELITNCQSSAEKAAAIIDRVLQLS